MNSLLSPFLKCWLRVLGTLTVAVAFLITAWKPVSSLAVVGSVTISTEVLDGAIPGLLLVRFTPPGICSALADYMAYNI